METKKYCVQPTFNYSDDDLLDIVSSATYDISYWGGVDNDANEWWDARSDLPEGATFEDLMYHILKKGEKVILFDVEDMDETWDLTLDKLLEGIKLTIQNGHWTGDMDDVDGEVGDLVFQYALFGEIVFG